jgi:hypothetical protein
MQNFIKDSLSNITPIITSMPYDALLYGKQENCISSALASCGNVALQSIQPQTNQYYRAEHKSIDICRLSGGLIDFGCECKYLYTSDFNEYGQVGGTTGFQFNKGRFKQLNARVGQTVNYVDFLLCYALEQIDGYTAKTNAKNNNLVVFNMICTPYGTNGLTCSNSGLKYLNNKRCRYDMQLLNNTTQQGLPLYIDNLINNATVCPMVNAMYSLQCQYKTITARTSTLGFDYYVITLAYSS